MKTASASTRFRWLTFALAVLSVGGCAPARPATGVALAAAAGNSLRTTVSTAYVESQTVSFALDRIDQRALPLDHAYKHFGSGRGVTVYVFDGGVLDTHPELEGRVRRGFNAFPNEDHLCATAAKPRSAGPLAGYLRCAVRSAPPRRH